MGIADAVDSNCLVAIANAFAGFWGKSAMISTPHALFNIGCRNIGSLIFHSIRSIHASR